MSSVSSSGQWRLSLAIVSQSNSSQEPPLNVIWSEILDSGFIYSQLYFPSQGRFCRLLTVSLMLLAQPPFKATKMDPCWAVSRKLFMPKRTTSKHSLLIEESKPIEYHIVLYNTAILSGFLYLDSGWLRSTVVFSSCAAQGLKWQ